MYPASFEYTAPRTLDEALRLLTKHGEDAKLLAGGHSLIPAMKLRLAQPKVLVDLAQLPDMRGIRLARNQVALGALTLHAEVAESDVIRQHVPALSDAASVIGDVQVRNRGTIGGSAAHADPAADYPVVLAALAASFVLASPTGTRTVAASDFFVDFYTTALQPDEVLTEVRVPLPAPASGTAYAKLPHPASGYVVVSAAALVTRDGGGKCTAACVALGGLAGTVVRATATEEALIGQQLGMEVINTAAALAADGAEPEDDVYASAAYKRHMATVQARLALEKALERAAR